MTKWQYTLQCARRVHDTSVNMLRGYLEVHSSQPEWDFKKVPILSLSPSSFSLSNSIQGAQLCEGTSFHVQCAEQADDGHVRKGASKETKTD